MVVEGDGLSVLEGEGVKSWHYKFEILKLMHIRKTVCEIAHSYVVLSRIEVYLKD